MGILFEKPGEVSDFFADVRNSGVSNIPGDDRAGE
jgi:hypothetical protein